MKNLLTPFLISVITTTLVLGVTSCNPNDNSGVYIDQRVAVVLPNDVDPYYLKIGRGVVGAGIEWGVATDFFAGDSSVESQIEILNSLDTSLYIAIIIDPVSQSELLTTLTALSASEDIVVVNNTVTQNVPYLTFVGTDQVLTGRQMAENVARYLSAGSQIITIHSENNNNAMLRVMGFNAAINGSDYSTETVIVDPSVSMDNFIDSLVAANPSLDAVLALDPITSHQMLGSLAKLNSLNISIFTTGTEAQIALNIMSGRIKGTMADDTYGIGYFAVKAIVESYLGSTPYRTQYRPTMFIDRNNINSSEATYYINYI